ECSLACDRLDVPTAPWIQETLQQAQRIDGQAWSAPIERRHFLDFGGRPETWISRHAVHYAADGKPQAVVARFREEEDAVELKRQLAAMRERFDDIARMVSDWIWETDRNLNISFVSSRVQEATGRHPRSLIGHTLNDLFVDESGALAAIRPTAPQPFRDIEATVCHSDGSERVFRLSAVPVYARATGSFIGFRGTAQDVTDRVSREAELLQSRDEAEAASRAKSEFLATVSHELRTPLNAIIGFSELMTAETFGPLGSPSYKEYSGDIHQSAQHLLELINDILDVSKIEAGRTELEEDTIDPAAIAKSALRLVTDRAQHNGISLNLALPLGLPLLYGDGRAVKQILLNLMSNAVKFTPEGGSVTLSAEIDDEGEYVFVVEDTGIGMTPEEIEIALTPFGQVDSRLSRRFPGTGLGLPLSSGLTRLHGGSLTVESTPNQGTRIVVRLPAERVLRD
ncbi:MAG: ATP-binding protein, partial [Tistlia sp.]